MGTWIVGLFLFPIATWNGIMSSTQPKVDVNTMNKTSASQSLFSNVIPNRVIGSDRRTLTDFSPLTMMASTRTSGASKFRMIRDDRDKFNANALSGVFQNGRTKDSGVLSSNTSGNFTVLDDSDDSSDLDLNESRTDVRNITDGNSTIIQMASGRVDSKGTEKCFVYIIVRCGIFFGGIGLIFFVGIGMYRVQSRCRPEWYDKV
ncbi:hypothetical protein ACJMK2_022825 [Sinanodonta woodiana]|uniref:Uncharacterized protein n=1 Tax=Sinanodonta woodiana TaxID=1069815 RepID=A0ABD3TK73_SINWO